MTEINIAVTFFVIDISKTVIKRKNNLKWKEKDKEKQLIKRGRYVEFNLLYDRGAKFGLNSGGNIDSIFLYHGIKLNPWYNYNKSFENLKEIKNLTIEVEKLSNKRLYKRLKNINKNDPKSDKYELQIKLIIDEYGRFLDVDIKNLENNYNNYINRFVKKLLNNSKWSPSMTIFKDKNNNYRMERNSIFFSIHFITI